MGVFLYLRPAAEPPVGTRSATTASGSAPAVGPPVGPPVTVPAVPRSVAADRACPSFLAALPDRVAGLRRRVVDASQEYAAAYGTPAVIIHCGVPRPAGFVRTSTVIAVDGVQWFTHPNTAGAVTWTAVDRSVYVSVRIPTGYSSGPSLVDVGTALRASMPRRPLRPAK